MFATHPAPTPTLRRFSPTGKIQATQLMRDLEAIGARSKIDITWEDYGERTQWEMVMVYDESLNLWYQALSHADINDMNAGAKPRDYTRILKQATPRKRA